MTPFNERAFLNRKKKKILFACDIAGTIDKASSNDYDLLCQKLHLLKEKSGADEIVFSFITGSSDETYLVNNLYKIKPFLEKYAIEIGKQYNFNQYYEKNEFIKYYRINKIDKIIDYARELKKECNLLSVYYVDDIPTYVNNEIKFALMDTYYCCLGIKEEEIVVKNNFAGSAKDNIYGVLEALDYHLESEKFSSSKLKEYYLKKLK